ncbi:hypothetical protein LSH36_2521g00021, partial [Paralvinella palmiformis]
MNRMTVALIILLYLCLIFTVGGLSIKFHPDNNFMETKHLTDNSSDTCFVFHGDTQVLEIQYTTLRLNTSA